MRRRAVLPFVLLLALVGAAPASAQTVSLQGSGQLEGASFHNFVVTADGQQPRGWLSVSGAYALHAVATCATLAPDAAVLGYRIDAGSNAGHGWLVSVQYGGSGTVVYAGTLPAPPARCPAPGSPAPPGFVNVGSGPVQNGSLIKSDAAPTGPTAIVDLVPPTGAFVGPGPFTAFAGLNGDDAEKVTLALYPGGGPVPIFTTTAVHGADGLDAQADVPALPPGPYTATWTLARHDGSTATASSAFTLLALPRPIMALRARVGCRRHACAMTLSDRTSAGHGRFALRRHRHVVTGGVMRVREGVARIPGLAHLPPGRYELLLLGPGRGNGHVVARAPFTLR
jgi:hypothetical protein